MVDVALWLQPDIFSFGILHAHPKLTLVYLKKVVLYTKSKAKDGGYPLLNWVIWKHMAVNKMLMEEDLAWAYFQLFFVLKKKTAKDCLDLAELRQQLSESNDSVSYKMHMSVPTLEFVLFLFVQQANKVSLRRSLLGEEWPGASPRLESPSHSGRSEIAASMSEEKKHIQFVLSHLTQMVELLSDSSKSKRKIDQSSIISGEVVKALGYIIHGKIQQQSRTVVYDLYELAIRSRVQEDSGYIRPSNCFAFDTFKTWLSGLLGENPYGLTSCLTLGTRLNWADLLLRKENPRKKSRITTNALSAPVGNKVIVFSQCSNQTIARQAPFLNGSSVKIYQCHSAYIYLLSPLYCVSVEKCIDTCLVLGPVATCVKITNCQNLTLIAPCQLIIACSSNGIKLFVTTPFQPLLLTDSTTLSSESPVSLAPYNTFYAELENHLAKIGFVVSPNTDQWNKPICICNAGSNSLSHSRMNDRLKAKTSAAGDASVKENKHYKLLNPSDFFLFSIPFKCESQTKNGCVTEDIPGALPSDYLNAVKMKQRAMERWRQAVKKSSMSKDERKSFQQLIEKKFGEWLLDTDHHKQLADLGYDQYKSGQS